MTTSAEQTIKPRPRVPKGNRPYALGDAHTERVLYMLMAVATEVSVLHDQLDTLARVASEKKEFTMDDLEQYEPDQTVSEARAAWRQDFLDRMFRILREEADEPEQDKRTAAYHDLVQAVSQ